MHMERRSGQRGPAEVLAGTDAVAVLDRRSHGLVGHRAGHSTTVASSASATHAFLSGFREMDAGSGAPVGVQTAGTSLVIGPRPMIHVVEEHPIAAHRRVQPLGPSLRQLA